jgi:hypothetical protein
VKKNLPNSFEERRRWIEPQQSLLSAIYPRRSTSRPTAGYNSAESGDRAPYRRGYAVLMELLISSF